jgi:hypothetical protein
MDHIQKQSIFLHVHINDYPVMNYHSKVVMIIIHKLYELNFILATVHHFCGPVVPLPVWHARAISMAKKQRQIQDPGREWVPGRCTLKFTVNLNSKISQSIPKIRDTL